MGDQEIDASDAPSVLLEGIRTEQMVVWDFSKPDDVAWRKSCVRGMRFVSSDWAIDEVDFT